MSQQSCNIERIGNRVVLRYNGVGVALLWQAAVEVYHAVKRLSEFSRAYAQHKDHAQVRTDSEPIDKQLTLHRTGLEFIFELQGRVWIQCPWTAAAEIAKGLYAKAKEVEEIEQHEQITEDAAILLRSGIGIGITDHPQIQKDAWKLAEDIRFPGCIEPTEFVGKPSIIQHDPTPQQLAAQAAGA